VSLHLGAVKHAGVGYHTPYLEKTDPDKVVVWGKYLVAISTLYFAGVNIPKLGILALYRRLFPPKGIRLIVHILMAVLVALTISTVVTAFAACVPFSANWSPKLASKHCIDKEAFFRWGSIPNILTDIVMLVLPIRVVWNLHTTTRLKVGLTLTFVIGSL
jgi:ABC-type enterobactin transport system permease subunit